MLKINQKSMFFSITHTFSGLLFFLFLLALIITEPGYALDDGIIPDGRRVDWKPGIEGSIPERTTIFADVSKPPYKAVGDDTTDATQAIQDAIDACPEGQVVYVPEGVYRLTNGLTINKGIVLRGAGPDRTKLKFYRSGAGIPNIYIRGGGPSGQASETSIQAGYSKGSVSLELESATGLESGDLVYITQDNDGEFVDNSGTGGDCTWCGVSGGENAMGQMLLIKSVAGNTITFEPELYWTYSATLNPYIKEILNPVKNAGLEDLYVDNVNEAVTISMRLYSAVNCWIRNIESNKGQRHIELDFAYQSVVRDNYIHHHHNYIPNHYSVLLGTFSTANLVENNLFYHTKGGTMMCAWGAAGNVFGYNFSRVSLYTGTYGIQSNITHHGSHPMMNLWEGNIVQKAGSDNYWGSISHNTLFRNYVTREEDPHALNYNRFCVVLEARCRYFNVVGNILGYPGMPGEYEIENQTWSFSSTAGVYRLGYNSDGDGDPANNDPEVKNTLLRHGNYNYIDENVIWDDNIAVRNIADSYYLSEKPQFFGSLAWPPIGPDVSGYVNKIPAQLRFESLHGNGTPATPQGLKVE